MKKELNACLFGAPLAGALLLATACGGGDDGDGGRDPLFPAKPECQGASVVPYAGTPKMVISHLEIGKKEDGFDLDGDGLPDNKLSLVGGLAGPAISDAFERYEVVLPIEFFDFPATIAPDTCVKFAVYLGAYTTDRDLDGKKSHLDGGDCNDHSGAANRDTAEVIGDGFDNDCDGRADEDGDTAALDDVDHDGDGISMQDGDCYDTEADMAISASIHPGAAEICGDGYDNDCDGTADRGTNTDTTIACSPYEPAHPQDIPLDAVSFGDAALTTPVVAFKDGIIESVGGKNIMTAGPSLFSVGIPVTDGLILNLQITGATIIGEIVMGVSGPELRGAKLGGVLDAHTADTIRGLDVEQIMLLPENSLLDATFANILGPILGLAKMPKDFKYKDCRTPDIDVDGDGLEAYCDSNPDDDIKTVDVCVDGNGDEVFDTATTQCTEALDAEGKLRFVDGISVELNFDAVPAAELIAPTPIAVH